MKNKILWRREQIIKIQNKIRTYRVLKEFGPKIAAVGTVLNLKNQLGTMNDIVSQLKKDKDSAKKKIKGLISDMDGLINNIRVSMGAGL